MWSSPPSFELRLYPLSGPPKGLAVDWTAKECGNYAIVMSWGKIWRLPEDSCNHIVNVSKKRGRVFISMRGMV